MNTFTISIVIPVYNEAGNIDPLLKRVETALKAYTYEVLFIDDGSTDDTFAQIKKQASRNPRIKLISFYRNFGHQIALSCGYQHAIGDAVISLDADCQDPPEVIPQMIEKWQKGAKIVYARRHKRDVDNFAKKLTANLFYRFINFLSDTPIPPEVGDFRLLDREVVTFLNELGEKSRFLRGLVAWGGYPAEFVYFDREKRSYGSTHYTMSKMLNFALEGMTSFSTKPLRLASYFGFISATVGFLGILYALIGRFLHPLFFPQDWVTGWTGLFVGIMFLGGVQLITIGIIGEYISRIYQQVQNRPMYLIKEKVNV